MPLVVRRLSLVLATLLLVATSGSPSWAEDPSAPKDGDAKEASGPKLNAYIKAHNTLLSTFGLSAQYQQYLGQGIARKTGNAPVFVNVGWLGNALDELQRAEALAGSASPEVDAAGAKLLPVLDQLVGRLKELNIYYESRANLEDNFARGKREDPLVIAGFKEATSDAGALGTALDAAISVRDEASLMAQKESGDLIGYDNGLALQKGKALIALFRTARDARVPALLERGDGLAREIEAALADERQQLAAAKAAGSTAHSMRNGMYGTAADSLQELVGAYRDLKHSGNAYSFNAMVTAYNRAVDHVNMGHLD